MSLPNLPVINSQGMQALAINSMAPSAANAAWPAANRALFCPFEIEEPFIVSKIFIRNGSPVAGYNLDVGIYDIEGTKIVSSGSTAASGTNTIQELTISEVTLAPGNYYLALACDSASYNHNLVASAFGLFALQSAGCKEMDSAFPLPATATFAVISANNVCNVAISNRGFT